MHYGRIITIVLLLLPAAVYTQTTNEAKKTDTLTYALYMKAAWNDLIELGESSIDEGIDFYYLRMRLGIAYYSEKDYISASEHFSRALVFVPKDPSALEYLYWCYVFSGQEGEARILASKFTDKFLHDIGGRRQSVINGVYLEGGMMINSDFNTNSKSGFGQDSLLYGEIKPERNSTYLSFNFELAPWSRLSLFQGYNNLNLTNRKKFISAGNGQDYFDVSTKQNEYYLNASVFPGSGFTMSGIFHYLNAKIDDVNASVNISTGGIVYNKTSQSLDNYIAMISAGKTIGKTRLVYGASYSNLNDAKQIQNSFTLIWYPLGNLNLYTVTELTAHSEKKEDSLLNPGGKFLTRGVVNQKIGFRVSDKFWLEGFYMFGNAEDYSENSAFVVFNSTGIMNNRFGVNMLFPVSPYVQISLMYQYYNMDIKELVYSSETSFTYNTKSNKFHKLIGGLKWTF